MVQAHEDRNLARQLTPAERREKKMKKLLGEAQEGNAPLMFVYRVQSLASGRHRFKVSMNAEVSWGWHPSSPALHILGQLVCKGFGRWWVCMRATSLLRV